MNQSASVALTCEDDLSGTAVCGNRTYSPAVNGAVSGAYVVDTSSPGPKSATITAKDAVGNMTTVTYAYGVSLPPPSTQVTVLLAPSTTTYPGSTLATVKLSPGLVSPTVAPTGKIQLILDGSILLSSLTLSGSGHGTASAFYDFSSVSAGQHSLVAVYYGDAKNPAGTSASVPLTILPAPVTLTASCVNPSIPSRANFTCNVYTVPILAGSPGTATYTYDNGAPVALSLVGGHASVSITKPTVGQHTLVVSYAAQGNYAAATSQSKSFNVTANH